MRQRIWLAGLGVLGWQLGSMAFGFNEFMFGHPPTPVAILASVVTVLAWMGLAAWAGYHDRNRFGVAVGVLWLAIVAALVFALWTRSIEGGSVAPWHGTALLLLIAAAGPIYGLGSLVPGVDPLVATIGVAALILVLVAVSFLVGRRAGRPKVTVPVAATPPG